MFKGIVFVVGLCFFGLVVKGFIFVIGGVEKWEYVNY